MSGKAHSNVEGQGRKRKFSSTSSGSMASTPVLASPKSTATSSCTPSPTTPASVFASPSTYGSSNNDTGEHDGRGKLLRRDSAEELQFDGRVDCMVLEWEGNDMPTPTYEEPDSD
ncbi:hypothetical protein VM1G_04819 [Cytospora mali]|uniref:Uncharacterized protein n=1 Tax=Cytospora mali TaxID=578113 RepID=A0A194VZG1_CYTMA|nr:hypothetical protein VM1G_04819 [Valsa mali]